MKLLTFSLWLVLVILQYPLWIGTGSLADVHNLQQQRTAQQQQIATYTGRNNQLDSEIQSLQQHAGAIENRARYELGLVRPNETYYHIIRHTQAH